MSLLLKKFSKAIIILFLIFNITPVKVYGGEISLIDIQYLERMVETEAFGASLESKINMANVALNRYKNSDIDLKDIITSPNQFAYFRTTISQTTKEAVLIALTNPDTTGGSTFFKTGKKSDSFFGANYLFTDDSGTHYYTNLNMEE